MQIAQQRELIRIVLLTCILAFFSFKYLPQVEITTYNRPSIMITSDSLTQNWR